MTFEQLGNLFINWGWEIKHEHYAGFKSYLTEMLKMDRVLVVEENDLIMAVLTYYITNDSDNIYKKKTWEIAKDFPRGTQIYIDKLIARNWNKEVSRLVRGAIIERFPQLQEAVYHRAPKDRCVKIKKGAIYELQSTIS